MRLLKLGIYYSAYVQDFYRKKAELRNKSYAVQHKTLIDDCFGSSDFWTRAFAGLNYETADLIANAEFLQRQWAFENDLDFNHDEWLFEIAAAQIKRFRPDVLLVADYSTFTAEFLRSVRRECSSIRLILGWCGAPYNDPSVFNEWDIALSCIPELVTEFERAGHRSFHINHAFAPGVLDHLDLTAPPSVNFAFTGSILKQKQFHIEREKLLLELVKHTDLQIRSDIKSLPIEQRRKSGAAKMTREVIAAARKLGIPDVWLNALPLVKRIETASAAGFVDERIARRAKPSLFGIEMFQQLRNSRVVLNNHIDISKTSASNMRLFEATGVGTCLLTDWKENLVELFQPGTEVITYRTPEECVENVKYIIEHEGERRAIAAAGQSRTLRDHTFENRVVRIDEIIKNFLS